MISNLSKNIRIDNHLGALDEETIIQSIYSGLNALPKQIASMYFYDDVGTALFHEITQLPEYYLTRTEKSLLIDISPSIGRTLKDVDIVEIGSGSSEKISILLDSMPSDQIKSLRYIPIDVSRKAIEESAEILSDRYPDLNIYGIVSDFNKQLHLIPNDRMRIFLFLGSTLGNMTIREMRNFFGILSDMMQSGDMFLLGIDLVKPENILETAYNDNQYLTAKFNKNILKVVNILAGTDFQQDYFEHIAFYNEICTRIEMHLKATRSMVIQSSRFPDDIILEKGEMIQTENSYKFAPETIFKLARIVYLKVASIISDVNKWFGLIQMYK